MYIHGRVVVHVSILLDHIGSHQDGRSQSQPNHADQTEGLLAQEVPDGQLETAIQAG